MDRNDLSSIAVRINGVYLEDAVDGYKTLNVQGREYLEKTLYVNENSSDGIRLNRTRFPERQIKVNFTLSSASFDDFEEKFETLMKCLNVENAEIVFNGEDDKYFIGTIKAEAASLRRVVSEGSFTILCTDPFKYGEEKTVDAVNGVVTVDYEGTYKAYPVLTVEFPATENAYGDNVDTSQCGYVGFSNDRENVLQFGDPEEVDWGNVTHKATTPINRTSFKSKEGWVENDSGVLTGTVPSGSSVAANETKGYIYPSSYGSGDGYHGPTLSLLLTNEPEPIGANFEFTWKQKFEYTKTQYGGIEVLLWNNDNGTRTLVAGMRILKTTKDTKYKVTFYRNSTESPTTQTMTKKQKVSTCKISRIDGVYDFQVGGLGLAGIKPKSEETLPPPNEVTFHFIRNGSKAAIGTNFVYSCKLTRSEFEHFEDIPNSFMPGQVLTVNTADTGVYLDDGSAEISSAYLGALGNDWEEFCLVPGENTIAMDYSDFTTTPPVLRLKYRERFL